MIPLNRSRVCSPLWLGILASATFALAACDSSKPATAAAAAPASGTASAIACPSQDLKTFVAAFAEDPALQKAFTAETVDTAFDDLTAMPEPAESVEALPRSKLQFPVMPNRAQQAKEGLKFREMSPEGDRAVVILEVPDTDANLRYTFRRDRCWTLIKIVDPAFGKAFPGQAPAKPVARTDTAASASASAPQPAADGSYRAPKGLSAEFAACMQRAGSQTIASAECLTAERSRQDARLNKVYKQLIGTLQGERRNQIVEAQRVWVQLQQKDGAFEASVFDELGPLGNLQSVESEALSISERADRLETYLELAKL
ncbi:lysozyme inhibitor LprI family protein [Pseudomonas sp. CGJS7]|uniref:lysozyme inhibitor LprI family protein n=1 Tax=Pseudomonas sp. CGJS7 TaxID=3109348 RepID=UPI00300A37AD